MASCRPSQTRQDNTLITVSNRSIVRCGQKGRRMRFDFFWWRARAVRLVSNMKHYRSGELRFQARLRPE